MPLSVNTLVSKIQTTLGVDETDDGFTAADILVMVNQILWEIDNQYRFKVQELETEIPTASGQRDYDLASLVTDLVAIDNVSIEDINSLQHTDLKRMTKAEYEDWYVNSADAYGKPTHYIRENFTLRLWPTPDQIYPIVVSYSGKIADLVAATTITSIPDEWQTAVYFGGCALGHFQQQQYRKASIMDQKYSQMKASLIAVESKEEVDSHTAGVTVLRRPYLRRFR